jgi:hypothetical protein
MVCFLIAPKRKHLVGAPIGQMGGEPDKGPQVGGCVHRNNVYGHVALMESSRKDNDRTTMSRKSQAQLDEAVSD